MEPVRAIKMSLNETLVSIQIGLKQRAVVSQLFFNYTLEYAI
jgi:hypothetical protein